METKKPRQNLAGLFALIFMATDGKPVTKRKKKDRDVAISGSFALAEGKAEITYATRMHGSFQAH